MKRVMYAISVWFLHLLILVTIANELPNKSDFEPEDLGYHVIAPRRAPRSVSDVTALSAGAAALLTSSNFIYGIVNGQNQLAELNSLVKKVNELKTLVNTRFYQLANTMDVFKIETLYGERVNRLRWFEHKKNELFEYNKNGTLKNVPQIKKWAEAVLSHGIYGIDNILFDIHNMALGNSGVFSSRAVVEIYREKAIYNSKSKTPCADLKAFVEFITALQADGYVAWAAAVNFKESLDKQGLDRQESVRARRILVKGSDRLSSQARFLKKKGILPLPEQRIDAALRHSNGRTYFFRGNKYWRYNDKEDRVDHGYPKEISEGWDGLPANIDAAFVWRKWPTKPWKIYFFKGDSYYSYTESHGLSEKHSISHGWAGMSSDISGVFNFRYEVTPGIKARTTYFVKGNNLYRYFRFREKLSAAGSIEDKWCDLSGPIDSVFRWSNGAMYIFKGDEYYKYNDNGNRTGGPWRVDLWRGLC